MLRRLIWQKSFEKKCFGAWTPGIMSVPPILTLLNSVWGMMVTDEFKNNRSILYFDHKTDKEAKAIIINFIYNNLKRHLFRFEYRWQPITH